MRVLILSDEPSWIINRQTDAIIDGIPGVSFTKGQYIRMSERYFLELADENDLVHYQNWILPNHVAVLGRVRKPVIMSVRSHRYPPFTLQTAEKVAAVHVVNRGLLEAFPKARYIPDILLVDPPRLRVGYAGKPTNYKGIDLIKQACDEIGAEFCTVSDIPPAGMGMFYRYIDVYCCASEAEGFATVVMEALAYNKPVVSTKVGEPWFEQLPGVIWVDRTVEDLKIALLMHWPGKGLGNRYSQLSVCGQFLSLYQEVLEHAA